MLVTVVNGNNADLIADVSAHYIADNTNVLDMTYGKGVFWKNTDVSRFNLTWFDINSDPPNYGDFRRVRQPSGIYDHVIFDPPYMHNPGSPIVNKNYCNSETHGSGLTVYHDDIISDYAKGMVEGFRLLKENGMLWVKCQDEIEGGQQRWSHIEIYEIAIRLGLLGKDMFILVPTSRTPLRHKIQQHAKKVHSYLWLFLRPDDQSRKKLLSGVIRKKAKDRFIGEST